MVEDNESFISLKRDVFPKVYTICIAYTIDCRLCSDCNILHVFDAKVKLRLNFKNPTMPLTIQKHTNFL